MLFVKRISLSAFCLVVGATLWAENVDTTTVYTIVDHIKLSGLHTISQPETMSQRLIPPQQLPTADGEENAAPASTTSPRSGGGYRIQVFSDSNPRTARNEARAKAGNIAARFPEYRTYVTYDAPYWRLRIGDFRSYEAAHEALSAIKEAFPAYRRELRVVRDRININN